MSSKKKRVLAGGDAEEKKEVGLQKECVPRLTVRGFRVGMKRLVYYWSIYDYDLIY